MRVLQKAWFFATPNISGKKRAFQKTIHSPTIKSSRPSNHQDQVDQALPSLYSPAFQPTHLVFSCSQAQPFRALAAAQVAHAHSHPFRSLPSAVSHLPSL
jgi:hypothetical protein